MIQRRAFLSAAAALTLACAAHGGEQPFLAELDWSKVNFLEATVSVRWLGSDDAAELEWKEDREGRFFDHYKKPQQGRSIDLTYGFDGTTYATMDSSSKDKVAKVKKSLPESKSVPWDFVPLDPFKFLADSGLDRRASYVGLREIAGYGQKKDMPKSPTDLKAADFGGKKARVFSVEGPGFGGPCTYRVYVTPADPPSLLGWECASKGTRAVLTINRWETAGFQGGEVKYPAEYVLQYYHTGKDGAEAATFSYGVNTVIKKVSDATDPAAFAVDIATADYVYDMDTKKLTPARKSASP